MNTRYYGAVRREILAHLPGTLTRLLDIGCGTGATTAELRRRFPITWAGGVEYVPEVAAQAQGVFEHLWTGDAASAPLEAEIAPASLDLILCLDVLEHMVDPWSLVQRLTPLLKPGGRLIVSVPNIRNWKVLWRLFFRGDFHYRESGILDRTHLRFFVRDTAIELATCGGLKLVKAVPAQVWAWHDVRCWLSKMSFSRLDEILAKQWLIVADAAIDYSRNF